MNKWVSYQDFKIDMLMHTGPILYKDELGNIHLASSVAYRTGGYVAVCFVGDEECFNDGGELCFVQIG